MFKMKLGTPKSQPMEQKSLTYQEGMPENMIPELSSDHYNQTTAQPDLSPDLNDSLPIDLPDHFDDLIGDVTGADVKTSQVVSGANIMSKDEYATFFRGGFKFARHMSGIKSLDITPENEEAAKGASDAVYETIMDIPSLHWMLDKALFGKWGERAFAIAAFSIPMAMAVKEELSQKKPAPQNSPGSDAEPNQQKPSPTPREPGEPDELAAATLTGGQ